MHWLAAVLLCLIVTLCAAAPDSPRGLPVSLSGDWQVTVGPGSVHLGGRDITVANAVTFDVTPPAKVTVKAESHGNLPVFNPKGNWRKGVYLNALRTQECSATGLLLGESVVVRNDAGEVLVRGRDYELDPFWGAIGRLEGGSLAPTAKVTVDYEYVPWRLDSIYADAQGALKLAEGQAGVGAILPPTLPEGAVAVVNIWHHGPAQRLTEEDLYPVEPVQPVALSGDVAERLLPRTLAKLRAGQEVKIVAWGDSVTQGGGVGPTPELWYQNAFARALAQRFPQAKITLLTAAWPGRNSIAYMAAPRGGDKDFVRDVLEQKPDLVTAEWVNDAGLRDEALDKHYSDMIRQLTGAGAEVILITPHLVRPDWMGVDGCKFDEDPRPYVQGLRAFAAKNNIALADASALWCRLWRQGIPYMTLEANSINHPDARGHQLFVQALMALFPER